MTSPPPAHAQPRRGALLAHLAAEAKQRGRTAAGRGRGLAGWLDHGAGLDQAAEILLVQVAARDRLDGGLQLGEREFRRHQLEDHRAILQLGAQARDRGRENAPMVEPHRRAERRQLAALERGLAAVAARLLDEARLVQELVAVEHLLLVPWAAARREALAQPLAPAERARGIVARLALRPGVERRQDRAVEDLGPPGAPVLPREEAVPRREAGAGRAQRFRAVGTAGERQVADRDHVRPAVAALGVPAAIAERVELLDIADREPGLLPDPAAQPDLEGVMRERIERAGRQAGEPRAVARCERHGLVAVDRDDRGSEPDLDRGRRGVDHAVSGRRNGTPSSARVPRPIASTAVTMRPLRRSIASANLTMRMLGVAVGEARRIAQAIARSSRSGSSAQTETNAAAVDRLIPAKQCTTSGAARSQPRTKSSRSSTCSASGAMWPSSGSLMSCMRRKRWLPAGTPDGRSM